MPDVGNIGTRKQSCGDHKLAKILVIGATGNVGSGVVASLAAKGEQVVALVHSGGTALQTEGVEAVAGDLANPASIAPAFEGVDRVFLVTRGTEDQVEMATNAVDAAVSAGVSHLVRMSAFIPEPADQTVLGRQHAEIEAVVENSGIPYTILRPTFFMQNIIGSRESVIGEGNIYFPFGDGKAGINDIRDIVDVAVEVLTSDGHEGQTYTITGPESVGIADVASALSDALGKPVNYIAVPVEAGVEAMVGMGMSQFMAETNGELMANFASNGADRTTDTVLKITGSPPRSVSDFAHDFSGMFVAG